MVHWANLSPANGTRQVCHLSTLIFLLILEPLLQRIITNPDITGVQVGKVFYNVAAFADNLQFFFASSEVTLPNLMGELDLYAQMSNYKFNYAKSEVMNLTVPETR